MEMVKPWESFAEAVIFPPWGDNFFADTKSYTAPWDVHIWFVWPVKPFKNLAQIFFIDPDTVIGDVDKDAIIVLICQNDDFERSAASIFNGVFDDVDEDAWVFQGQFERYLWQWSRFYLRLL